MSLRINFPAVLLILAAGVMIAGPVCAKSVRQVQVIDPGGARIETQVVSTPLSPVQPPLQLEGLQWHYNDPAGIIESCVLGDITNETWLGVNLNNEGLVHLETMGDGTPVYVYPFENPDLVTVASAEIASLVAVLQVKNGRVGVETFTGSDGDGPVWTYAFDSLYSGASHFGVDVSADGSLVAAIAFQQTSPYHGMLVILDGDDGEILQEQAFDFSANTVELSYDGARAVVTAGATARIYETATLTELFSFGVSGAGGVARISGDGLVAVAGGFNVRAFRDTGSGWVQVHSQQDATQWYGAVALSGDGNTLLAGSRNYTNEIITLRFVDLVAGVEMGRYVSTPTGANQDVVARAEVSQDGSVIAVATWGQETDPHPEVMIFDREANLIGEIDMPGSAWTVDLSADGRFVVASGKNVHANEFGSGGDAFVYDLGGVVPIEQPEPPAADDLPQLAFDLAPNFPNPFNPQTSIGFTLPRAEHVRLDIFDARGRLVRTLVDASLDGGRHTVVWNGLDQDGRSVPSGTYVYRLESDASVRSRTLSVLK